MRKSITFLLILLFTIPIIAQRKAIENLAFSGKVVQIEQQGDMKSPTACDPVTNLTSSVTGNDVTLNWTAPTGKSRAVLLSEDFETVVSGGIPAGWKVIDADGDGRNWYGLKDAGSPVIPGHSGTGLMTSASWASTALNPNNYLITPIVEGAIKVTYWIGAQDGDYPAEHYALCASSTGTNAADFTIIFQETLTSKGSGLPKAPRGTRAQGTWYERTVNLPAGTKYVAWRHFNCSDEFRINLDDVLVESSSTPATHTYTVLKDGTEIATGLTATNYTDAGVSAGTYNYCVKVVYTGCVSTSVCTSATVGGSTCPPVTNLTNTVTGSDVTLNWIAPTGKSRAVLLSENFESVPHFGVPTGWKVIDADGDGQNWVNLSQESLDWISGHNSSLKAMGSFSWNSEPLTPDNYIITPLVEGASTLKYFVSCNAAYPADHYAVMVSSTGTNAADFTTVFEETLTGTSKGLKQKYSIGKTNGTRDQSAWFERNIDLPPGTKYIAWRHYNCSDENYMLIDDVLVEGEGAAVPDFTYTITKDGAEITTGLTDTNYTDAGVSAGTYNYCVKVVYDACTSSDVCTSATVEGSTCPPVTNLTNTVDGSDVTLNWTAPAGKSRAVLLSEDFESIEALGIPEGWKVIDADGDGKNWYGIKGNAFINGHSGDGLMTSASYSGGVLTPDNYLITPLVEGATKLTYWVCAQDAAWAAEHYSVLASSTGTEIADFTVLFEETLTGGKALSPEEQKAPRGTRAQGTWFERTFDLPAGTKYVAWRHFDCSDMFRMNIDDVLIEGEGAVTPDFTYTITKDGAEIATGLTTTSYTDAGVDEGTYNYCVKVVYTGCVSTPVCTEAVVEDTQCPPVTNLTNYVEDKNVVLNWNAPGSKSRAVLLSEDFESVPHFGIPTGWQVIDADGDGHNWVNLSKESIDWISGHNSSLKAMGSFSWDSDPLTPDNYLITPLVEGASTLSYFVSCNAAYPADHYAVMVSSTGTNAADFTTVFEETLTGTSKGLKQKYSLNQKNATRDQSEWFERNIDLPAGTKYIAFRHYNCSDENYMLIDDVLVEGEDAVVSTDYTYKVYRDSEVLISGLTEPGLIDTGLEPGTYNYCVSVVYDTCESNLKCTVATVVATLDPCNPVTNLTNTVEGNKVTLNWTAPEAKTRGVLLSEDFETVVTQSIPSGWKVIDADGDGKNWYGLKDAGTPVIPGHSGTGLMTSASWAAATLTPNNYLITPLVDGATKVTYWVSAQDADWPTEHYAVCASTTGTEEADFSIVFEETLTAKGSGLPKAPRGTRAQGTWYERSVDLPAGTKYIAWRHFNSTDIFRINLDDVTVEGEAVSADYTYTVTKDGAEVATGLTTTTYVEQDVEAGTYNYCVKVVYAECTSEEVCTEAIVEAVLPCPPITDLTSLVEGNDVTLNWKAPAGKNRGVILSEDFETVEYMGAPVGWKVIDADGDGKNWYGLKDSGTPVIPGHSGTGLMTSASWASATLTPDNYLITPKVDGATKVTYWVSAQDADWPSEHYAVCASTTGTEVADFSIVFEETLTAKGSGLPKAPRGTRAQGNWYERTVDLPAGTKYIAWRHFNSTDIFRINLDDVTVEGGAASTISYNVYRNNTLLGNTAEVTYKDLNAPNGTHVYCVEAVHQECTAEKVCINVQGVSTNEHYKANINIYPNPVGSILNIEGHDIQRVNIYNYQGKLVMKDAPLNINVSDFANGIYFAEIYTSDGKPLTYKFVVKK